jgi:hypothetical protein
LALTASKPANLVAAQSGFVSMNTLRLQVTSDQVDNRPVSVVSLPSGSCTVPTATVPRPGVSATPACQEDLTLDFDWPTLRPCLSVTTVGTQQVFTGTLRVTQTDTLDALRNEAITRTTVTDLEYTVAFETESMLTLATVRVFAPVAVQAAVTQSRVVTTAGASASPIQVEVRVFTSVQGPYQIGTPTCTTGGGARVPSPPC